ncbi:MAG: hypothetical protein A2Z18_07010 [Armatimonadetes bacterium RBG_16_58_9]|nr:MAG: hypothetical protein A2Z18_07010 [Armatimonadetes bacterium RBG_16_58_9]
MDIRIFKLPITLAVVVAALACASVSAFAAGPYYAVSISTTRLYLMTTGAPGSAVPVYEFGGGASLSDVKVYGNTVFVSDKAAGSVHILRLHGVDTSPYAQFIKTVPLDDGSLHVEQPLSLDISSDGRSVYAVGKTWLDGSDNRHSNFAYLTSASGNWTDAQMQMGSLTNSPMVDVATSASGAIIAHTHIPSGIGAGSTWVSSVSGTTASSASEVGDKSFSPQAIAVNGAYGYVVNAFADDTMAGGSLSVIDAATRDLKGGGSFILPDSLMPQDIVAFNYGTKNYVGIVGTMMSGDTPNVQQVWRVELDTAGMPNFGAIARYTFIGTEESSNHYLAVSDNGARFWISNGAAQQSVIALDTSAWQKLTGLNIHVDESIRQIDTAKAIPEPSTLATLVALGLTAAGVLRRRKR